MYRCRLCEKKGKDFRTPLGTYGSAIMQLHLETDHPDRFLACDEGDVMPLFGKHNKDRDNDAGRSEASKKSKRINDAARNQRHKNTLSKQKQTKRDK